MPEQPPIVHVVDDDPEVCRSLRWLIESVGLEVETYESAEVFLDSYDPQRTGCIVLDVRMPGMSGLELQEHLSRCAIDLPVILVSAHADVPMAVQAMKVGAVHFLEKPYRDQALLEHVQSAIKQDAQLRQRRLQSAEIRRRLESLTPREREVVDLIVAGRATKQIAFDLGISPRTVEVHRAHVMEKMQADSLATLVQCVVRSTNEA